MSAQSFGWARRGAVVLVLAASGALAACEQGSVSARSASLPASVGCTDAAALRQRAGDDRRRSADLKSDQAKIDTANQAAFLASLATIADLKCKVTAAGTADVDAALKRTLDSAHKATSTRGFYERSSGWTDANFMASEVIALLAQRIPNSASR